MKNSVFYSKSDGGFYVTEIHGKNMPNDVVEITSEKHQELLEGQANRMEIKPDENGFPILIAPTETVTEEQPEQAPMV